jgi:hypothetical protein
MMNVANKDIIRKLTTRFLKAAMFIVVLIERKGIG